MKHRPLKVIHAAAVRDATGINARPGAVLVEDGKVVAAGELESLPRELVEQAEVIDRRDSLLLPGMVNAHTHLELTEIGPQPYRPEEGFVGWVQQLRELIFEAIAKSGLAGPDWFAQSAGEGWFTSWFENGVAAVGDIAQSQQRVFKPGSPPFCGKTYIELFGLGPPFDARGLAEVARGEHGLQPHAPYSAGPSLYEAAARSGRPVSTHLAETMDECRFVAEGRGPWLDYLQRIERWSPAFAADYGRGQSPVQWMRPHLEQAASAGGWLVAHCNYVSDQDIGILADTNTSVAYCPVASEYFGHIDHRYREMLEAGVNVCLGTDSIVCQPADEPQPLGLLAPMRRLYDRDRADPATLLAMATTHGAKALRLSSETATLRPGAEAMLVCIPIDAEDQRDALVQALASDALAQPLWLNEQASNKE